MLTKGFAHGQQAASSKQQAVKGSANSFELLTDHVHLNHRRGVDKVLNALVLMHHSMCNQRWYELSAGYVIRLLHAQ